jgi:hypothetical protein
MKKVALNLQNITVSNKIPFGRDVAGKIDGNSNFPTPKPTVAEINTATDNLEEANNAAVSAYQTAKEKTAELNKKENEFDTVMTKVGSYVETESNGDEQKILSAGLTPKADGVHSEDVLPMPENLSATLSDEKFDIDLQWDKVEGASSYAVEMTTDPSDESSWKIVKIPTKSSTTITGLTSGQRYHFRVSAVNANGQSAPSETASKVRW